MLLRSKKSKNFWLLAMPAISEKSYAKLHRLLEAIAKAAYEQGYKDSQAKKPMNPEAVRVAIGNTRRIKLD